MRLPEGLDRWDALGLFGLLLLSAGSGWVYPPASLMVAGTVLLAWAAWQQL